MTDRYAVCRRGDAIAMHAHITEAIRQCVGVGDSIVRLEDGFRMFERRATGLEYLGDDALMLGFSAGLEAAE